MSNPDPQEQLPAGAVSDPREPLGLLFRDLRSSAEGLTAREAARRALIYGPNQLSRRGRRRWPGELAAQFTHPLATLLAAAAVLAGITGSPVLAAAILGVVVLNAVFAFFQEQHAEHAVEALAAYLPSRASVLRDGSRQDVDATTLVPGDVLVVEEGDRISADARLITGSLELDLSTLTGESQSVTRTAGHGDASLALLQAEDMLFSGSACLGGEARAVVTATGMRTEIGRIAALSERAGRDASPLETQVKSVAKLIAVVAVAAALALLPLRERLFKKALVVKTLAPLNDPDKVFTSLPTVEGWRLDDAGAYVVLVTDPRVAAPQVTRSLVGAGANVLSIGESQHSLEDVYLELIDEDAEAGT